MSGDDSKIVKFPQPEIAPEERARRLRVEVDRLEQRADLEGWQVKCLIASGGTFGCGIILTGFRQSCDAGLPRALSTFVQRVWT